MSDKKAHGERNKNLCDHLYDGRHYFDWVITTAFYSAIHFVDFKIFPFEHNGTQIKSLDFAFKHQEFKKGSRHETRAYLVYLKLPKRAADFKYLQDTCWNARYVSYKTTQQAAEMGRLCLDSIIAECSAK